MSVDEASFEDTTPYGRYVTAGGWFVLNLGEALAAPFLHFGVDVRVPRPGEPNCLYLSESGQEGSSC